MNEKGQSAGGIRGSNMKQLIVLLAVLPLMLVFIMQFAQEQENSNRIQKLENYVNTSKEVAKQEGFFSTENIASLKIKIAETFQLSVSEISFEGSITPKYRVNQFDQRELIYYKVGVPVKKIMAGASLMGISHEENKGYYYIDGFTASEALLP